MNRLDRALGILLLLRQGRTLSAPELARRFEVSSRTIYRDVQALSELGIPVYAEMGREGGFRLLEGYFLPPVMFSTGEATSLLLGLTLLRCLRVSPFPAEQETAEQKLLAAVPDQLRIVLARTPQMIGFERIPPDLFHWGLRNTPLPEAAGTAAETQAKESHVVNLFLRSIFERKKVCFHYHSPYKAQNISYSHVAPCGLLWDRDWWYLAGERADKPGEVRLWRADRVLALEPEPIQPAEMAVFDINDLLGRSWLQTAMAEWMEQSPVKLRLTRHQAEMLQQDWYYRYARFEPLAGDQVLMTFGESNPQFVLDLVLWLGPGAELLEPQSWRSLIRAELTAMLASYPDGE